MAKKKTAEMPADLEAAVYSSEGKKSGTVSLPGKVFGQKWNSDLVHQVVTAMQANARQPWAHAKMRGEVSGSGKKPWRQKGTGRARHGMTRSPIWRKGGVTHGPRNDKSYEQKINRKMRVAALYSALSKKFSDGEVLFISDLAFKEPKTKAGKATLGTFGKIGGFEKIATRRKNAAYIVTASMETNVKKSFQNMGNVLVGTVGNMNPVDLLTYKYLVLTKPEECVKVIEAKSK
jgi:large subunit ribosomal protein L4